MPSPAPARIVNLQGKLQWRCPYCGKMLGEMIGNTLIVRENGREIESTLPSNQKCPTCAVWSAVSPYANTVID